MHELSIEKIQQNKAFNQGESARNLAVPKLQQYRNIVSAVNQDHKKNNHAQEHKKYSGKTLLNQGKNPTIPLLYCQEKIHHPPPNPSTQEGAV